MVSGFRVKLGFKRAGEMMHILSGSMHRDVHAHGKATQERGCIADHLPSAFICALVCPDILALPFWLQASTCFLVPNCVSSCMSKFLGMQAFLAGM